MTVVRLDRKFPPLDVLQARLEERQRKRLREWFWLAAIVLSTLGLNRLVLPAPVATFAILGAFMWIFWQDAAKGVEIKELKRQISEAEDALLFEESRISPEGQRWRQR